MIRRNSYLGLREVEHNLTMYQEAAVDTDPSDELHLRQFPLMMLQLKQFPIMRLQERD